jgi:hypothetical protein
VRHGDAARHARGAANLSARAQFPGGDCALVYRSRCNVERAYHARGGCRVRYAAGLLRWRVRPLGSTLNVRS